MNLHLKNNLDIHTSSNKYEENGYGLNLDPLMISYYGVFKVLGEMDLETLRSRPIMSYFGENRQLVTNEPVEGHFAHEPRAMIMNL